jgi:exodeoxyribonuclease-1
MSFVVYDVETTGTNRSFDQILQFAAIRTDSNLKQIDAFDTRCRLLPHVIPAPGALAINGLRIGDITASRQKSHYAMMTEIRETLIDWCPTIFLGFNSIRFDEEFLRYGFYQCLYPPYLTNTKPNARADVLSLVRAFASFHPEELVVPYTLDGRPTFSLRAFATANGFPDFAAHEAMADVKATLHICQLIAQRSPELWSRFLHFAQKAAAIEYLQEEPAFLLFEPTARRASFCVTWIGANRTPQQSNVHYCLNLQTDIDALRALSPNQLADFLVQNIETVRRVRINASPMFCPLYEAPAHLLADIPDQEWHARANRVRSDKGFVDRLQTACELREKKYEPSIYVEQQLYELGFWSDADAETLLSFHTASWEDRAGIARRFEDKRLRVLARRLIYVERSDLFTESERKITAAAMRDRIHGIGFDNPPWMTIDKAKLEVACLNEIEGATEEYSEFLTRL